MRLRFVWIGKTRDANIKALVNEYLKRLGRYARYEVRELRESASSSVRTGIEDESRRIIGGLHSDGVAVLLDIGGRDWSSPELATEIEKWQQSGVKEVAFIIGGPNGVSEELATRSNVRWSLSRLTLTHEMSRVLLVEQIYRAYTIITGSPYQK